MLSPLIIMVTSLQVDIQVAMVISITIILVRNGLILDVKSQQNPTLTLIFYFPSLMIDLSMSPTTQPGDSGDSGDLLLQTRLSFVSPLTSR